MLLLSLSACLFSSRSPVAASGAVEARIAYPKADRTYGLPEPTIVDVARIRPEPGRTCFELTRRWATAPGVVVVGTDLPDPQDWQLVTAAGRARAAEVRYGEPREAVLAGSLWSGTVLPGYCHAEVCVAWDAAGGCVDTECVDEQQGVSVVREATAVTLRERDDTVCFDQALPDAEEEVELHHVFALGRQRFRWQLGG